MNPQQRRRWKSFWNYQIKIGKDQVTCERLRDDPDAVFDAPDAERDALLAQAWTATTRACLMGAQRQREKSKQFWSDLKADPERYAEFVQSRAQRADEGRRRKKRAS